MSVFRAYWSGHVEIEASSRQEAEGIHEAMTSEAILEQLIFDGIEGPEGEEAEEEEP